MQVLLATVHRKRDHIPVQIYEHEIRILEAMYGAGSVQVVDDDYDDIDLDPNADDEFARLRQKYSSKNDDPVLRAYPGGPATLPGFKSTGSGSGKAAPAQSINEDRRVKKAKKKA